MKVLSADILIIIAVHCYWHRCVLCRNKKHNWVNLEMVSSHGVFSRVVQKTWFTPISALSAAHVAGAGAKSSDLFNLSC